MSKFFILLIISLCIGCSVNNDTQIKDNPNLLIVTDTIKNYADNVIQPKIYGESNDILKLLKIVAILLDKESGISTSNINPSYLIVLSFLSGHKFIDRNSCLLFTFPDNKKEIMRSLHNIYMLQDTRGIFFGPTASDIVKYKFAFGCTHYARVFMTVVKYLKIIKNSKDMRYVISCNSEDYNNYLISDKKINYVLNGHQFVIVKINNRWYAINTNKMNDFIEFPDNFSPEMNIYERNYSISFKGINEKIFLLRKIGKDYNDNCNDNSFQKLMNIYISGKPASDKPMWKKY